MEDDIRPAETGGMFVLLRVRSSSGQVVCNESALVAGPALLGPYIIVVNVWGPHVLLKTKRWPEEKRVEPERVRFCLTCVWRRANDLFTE